MAEEWLLEAASLAVGDQKICGPKFRGRGEFVQQEVIVRQRNKDVSDGEGIPWT